MNCRIAIAALAIVLSISPAAAQSTCKPGTLTATGEKKAVIDDATASAMAAAKAEMTKRYGKGWTTGSRRAAKFTCVKPMGGNPRHLGWTCTLETAVCRDFSS
jgi:hypothetical protein